MKVTLIFAVLLAIVAMAWTDDIPALTEEQQVYADNLLSVDEQGHENLSERQVRQGWGRGGGGWGGRGGGWGGRGGGWGGRGGGWGGRGGGWGGRGGGWGGRGGGWGR